MTWTAALLPDDELDPDSLIGNKLNPAPAPPPPATVEPMPLWRVMIQARCHAKAPDIEAAGIEALRDWLLPEEPEPTIGTAAPGDFAVWGERQRLRSVLTEQARIARGGS